MTSDIVVQIVTWLIVALALLIMYLSYRLLVRSLKPRF